MIYTLGYAREKYAKFVDSGSSPDSEIVVDRINDAIRQILMIEDWALTVQRMRFYVLRNTITLPYFAEKIVACRFDTSPSPKAGYIFSQGYEFMEGGPLRLSGSGYDQPHGLQDWGGLHRTAFDIDRGSTVNLVAFSTMPVDAGLTLSIRGVKANGEETAIQLPINPWLGGVEGTIAYDTMKASASPITDIVHLVKPTTAGYVSLYAIDITTKKMWFLSKYHPSETMPGYRKYLIAGKKPYGSESVDTVVPALVKMRFVPAVLDEDPLLVQNPDAIKAMIQSMAKKDAGDLTRGVEYARECLWLLGQQLKNVEPMSNEIQVQHDFSLGEIGTV